MISLCTVTLAQIDPYLEIMLDSVVKKTTLVSEVLIAEVGAESNYEKEWHRRDIVFRRFGLTKDDLQGNIGFGHPLGIEACFARATNEYVWSQDPDCFLYSDVDQTYHSLMDRYNLGIIGCSHPAAVCQANTFFPNVVNMMLRKKDLPPSDFLLGLLKFRPSVLIGEDEGEAADGHYMIAGPIPQIISQFPNTGPEARYDTGINLWVWGLQNDWKWLAFQTLDCHTYNTAYMRGNVQLEKKLPKKKLLYHATASACSGRTLDAFREAYEASEEDE